MATKKKTSTKPAPRSTPVVLTARGHDALIGDARRATDAELAANLRASVKNYNRDLTAARKAGLIVTAIIEDAPDPDSCGEDSPTYRLSPEPVRLQTPPVISLAAINREHL